MIRNGSSIFLNQTPGTLPSVGGVLSNWFQKVQFITVQKIIMNYQVFEVFTQNSFKGVCQPMSAKQMQIKPEGQRNWSWFTIHATPDLLLQNDDVIYIDNLRLRVMDQQDYSKYGYVEYHAQQDFTDSLVAPVLPNEDDISKFVSDIIFTSPLTSTIDSSSLIPDAKFAVWSLIDILNGNVEVIGAIQVLNYKTVQITVPVAGTYRLIGAY